jgi:curli biogenesis system outer membrane secretion channel CsgG
MRSLRPLSLILLTLFLFSGCAGIPRVPYEKRLIIAVADFANLSELREAGDIMKQYTGSLIFELQKRRTFRIIERKRLDSLLKEHRLSMSGLTDPSQAKKAGKILGADALLLGNLSALRFSVDRSQAGSAVIEEMTAEAVIDAQVITIETGEIVASSRRSGDESNTVRRIGENLKTGIKIAKRTLPRRQ